jgi:hypothetical protein
MRNLTFELKLMCRRNRDGSYATQRDRERVLDLVADQLQELGYRHMAAASLKPKHVECLVERWQAEGLAVGTIKNRMAELRWWAEKIGKQNVIARDNSHYGIENRKYVTNVSKARELTSTELGRITDPYTAMSLRLQAAFGLRREESIKIRPEWADRGNLLALKDTWTKGGRAREIPISNDEQRQVLAAAKSLAGRGSLIPADRSYVDQLRRFEHQCAAAGVHRIHGHRHQYAQGPSEPPSAADHRRAAVHHQQSQAGGGPMHRRRCRFHAGAQCPACGPARGLAGRDHRDTGRA